MIAAYEKDQARLSQLEETAATATRLQSERDGAMKKITQIELRCCCSFNFVTIIT